MRTSAITKKIARRLNREANNEREMKMKTECLLRGYAVVVVDRGFVYVGNVEVDEQWCIITDARNIRYWGTKSGLGQLVLDGPQPDTKLDPCGTVRVPKRALVSILDTEEKKWN